MVDGGEYAAVDSHDQRSLVYEGQCLSPDVYLDDDAFSYAAILVSIFWSSSCQPNGMQTHDVPDPVLVTMSPTDMLGRFISTISL
jgi:hypothetical protein